MNANNSALVQTYRITHNYKVTYYGWAIMIHDYCEAKISRLSRLLF